MNADVLLFSLDHPDTFLAHLVHDSENVNDVVLSDSLQDSIQGYEGSAPSNASTAMEFRSVKVEVKVFEDLGHSSHLQWTTIGRCSGLTRSLNARTNLLVKLVLMVMMVIMIDGHDGRQHVELSVADQSGRAQK